jgi:hypothetical protein
MQSKYQILHLKNNYKTNFYYINNKNKSIPPEYFLGFTIFPPPDEIIVKVEPFTA